MINAAKDSLLMLKKKQRIGIYSGTFDPIHEGHVAFAKEAIAQAALDKVYFLVEPRPRHKQGVKALDHRLAMVGIAIANEPALGLVVLDQARFSVHETWPKLLERFKGARLCMLMGEDVFRHLSHWPHVDELLESAEFVIGLRRHSKADIQSHLATIEQTKGAKLRRRVFTPSHATYSSTSMRLNLKKGKIPKGLHPEVLQYIKGNQLYVSKSVE